MARSLPWTGSDIDTLLSAASSPARVATVAKVALSQGDSRTCPAYLRALMEALAREPPPFGTREYSDVYRAAAADRQWMAISLMANAEREGDGATRLWSLAACSADPEEVQLLKEHAVDESRHALAYLALLDLAFPDSVEPKFRAELEQLSPRFRMSQPLRAAKGSPYARTPSIDDFVQMNIAEIRTTIHHLMQRVALSAHCPPENLVRMTKVLDMLLRDELRHVAYTAVLIDRKAASAGQEGLPQMFCRRMRDFNRITHCELAKSVLTDPQYS